MDTNQPTTVYITTQPTVKEMTVQLAFGVAASIAVTALTIGAFALAGTVMQKVQDRKDAKTNTQTDEQ